MYWGQTIGVSLDLEPSLRAGSLYAYGILCPGPICLMVNGVGSPWAWRNWLSVGTLSRRFGVFKLTCRL